MNRTYWLLVAMALAAGFALFAVMRGSYGAAVLTGVLAVLLPLVYFLFRLLLPIMRKSAARDLFSPLAAFPIVYIAWFAVGTIDFVDVPSDVAYGLFEPVPKYVLGFAALGLAAYVVGVLLHRSRSSSDPARTPEFTWSDSGFLPIVAGLGFLMVASYVFIVAGMGGIPALDPNAGELRLQITSYGPAEAVLFTSAWTLIPMLMIYVWHRHPRTGVRLLCYAGVAVSSLLLLSLGGRTYLFVPLLTTLVARHYGKQRFKAGKLALVCITLFCGISLFGYTRDMSLTGAQFGEERLGIPGPVVPLVYAYLYVRYPVATFRDITTVIPHQIPYQYGALSFGPLATLLPGHHEQSDIFFKNILGNDFVGAGQPATLLGPLYADAGWFGIVAGMLFAGVLTSHVYAWMLAAPTMIRVLLYAWLMQTLLFSVFLNLFPFLTTIWIPAFWVTLNLFMRPSQVSRRDFARSTCPVQSQA
jgi:oligosaccharide repeat unit polymerase